MRKHYGYHSTLLMPAFLKELSERAQYIGRDPVSLEPQFDTTKPLPEITVKGSVKLHGSNCSIVLTAMDDYYPQARDQITSETVTNYGFHHYALLYKQQFKALLKPLLGANWAIIVYGEWCGKEISYKTALEQLDYFYCIFGIKIIKQNPELFNGKEPDDNRGWLDASNFAVFNNPNIRLYNIDMFKTYELTMDLNRVDDYVPILTQYTQEVAEQCPVAAYFGAEGFGEGIVWWTEYNGKRFYLKIKGKNHSHVKTKQTVQINDEKLNSIIEFIEYAFTEARLDQQYMKLKELGELSLGNLIKHTMNDVLKEEIQKMNSMNITTKDLNNRVTRLIKDYYNNAIQSN